MPLKSFKGGIHPLRHIHHGKGLTNALPIAQLKNVSRLIVPMSQHIGAPCEPTVQVGDRVLKGQVIGKAGGFVSAPVHAPVSGIVTAIGPHALAGGAEPVCVFIENDKLDEWHADCRPLDKRDKQSLIKAIWDAGIVGMGGAAFPTHVKLSPPEGTKIDYLILNGAECEPYLSADHRMMVEHTRGIIKGALLLNEILGAENLVIGVENNKPDAIQALKEAAAGSKIEIATLEVKYPQGGEKQLIQAVTGRQVPSGGLPMNAGCIVSNVSTAFAVYEAIEFGYPLIKRVVSVTGSGVVRPANIEAPIGTPVSEMLRFCGGLKRDTKKLISGGPMMGIAMADADCPVTKGMSGILALTKAEVRPEGEDPCIHCGKCVRACPVGLLPYELRDDMGRGDWDTAEKHNALDCIECGSCSYICPASRELVSGIRIAKKNILAAKKAKK